MEGVKLYSGRNRGPGDSKTEVNLELLVRIERNLL
jgi:hypothetical protein